MKNNQIIIAVILVSTILSAGCSSSSPSSPSPSSSNSQSPISMVSPSDSPSSNSTNIASSSAEHSPSVDNIETQTIMNPEGNTTGNIANSAFAVQDAGEIYYVQPARPDYVMWQSDLTKIGMDGSNKVILLTGDRQGHLNISNGWIYYISGGASNGGLIYKVREDGTENMLVTTSETPNGFAQGYTSQNLGNIQSISVVGDWIYCSVDSGSSSGSPDENNGIYKINAVTGNVTQLLSARTGSLVVYNDWLCYSNGEDGWKAYKIRTDGTENTMLTDFPVSTINIYSDMIYCVDTVKMRIYGMNLDGTSAEIINSSSNILKINVTDGWIYFVSSNGLYKMKTDGSGITRLCDYESAAGIYAGNINIVGEWVYFLEQKKNDAGGNILTLSKIKNDGSELQEVK